MMGINLVSVAKILLLPAFQDIFLGKHGAIKKIYEEIIKSCAENDIQMTRELMRTLSRQHEQQYNNMVKILRSKFTEEELRDILSN
ncbi:MAG: hypothetical protein BWY08_02119 [Bacteroidetes bacterium ADurb.Bin174]|jgi:predicted RNA-binding protein|nr:MAG: hypothetical protein BWY08_02119 [Bacteroidetes bacterium ADurb.Bin174]